MIGTDSNRLNLCACAGIVRKIRIIKFADLLGITIFMRLAYTPFRVIDNMDVVTSRLSVD